MDPVSALSVAAAVVQFIELAGKLVNTYCEVRSAAKASVASRAQDKLKSLGSSYPRHVESLLRLTTEVVSVESKIESAMAKLTVNPRKYETHSRTRALVAIRTFWSEAEFKQWNQQLDRIRDQVMMNVLMCVWDETRKFDTRAEHILQAVERIEKAIDTRNSLSEGLSDTATTVDSIGPAPVQTPIDEQKSFEAEILRSLKYDEIKNRASSIKSAFPDTFQWIFKDNRHGFQKWLISQDKSIFWITGVPASGKSTLMKFIIEHPKLNELLKTWACVPEQLLRCQILFLESRLDNPEIASRPTPVVAVSAALS
ncbi:hypothetical protein Aspvir_003621 [Aspergillus viridinutans]|uniref:Nephrocystin 3-like N-terminal domain-containing protein n=1 Tax=Aspergillus viridinutans TaxID=75553 RepID=A0A9P3F308_ASPVI|nr:uncharacterized protein Aspvir_003621 [Aspergillus viridinutans]GIJ99620.1 hypothetical protein Aspvir_003621 [Aspergillus viridinutans]